MIERVGIETARTEGPVLDGDVAAGLHSTVANPVGAGGLWGMRRMWLMAGAMGCFQPHPQEGAPCATNGDCPASLFCSAAICVATPNHDKGLPDASPPDVSDAGGCSVA